MCRIKLRLAGRDFHLINSPLIGAGRNEARNVIEGG